MQNNPKIPCSNKLFKEIVQDKNKEGIRISGSITLKSCRKFHLFEMFSPDQQILLEKCSEGFPGGSMVKNPPANAGDTGLILGLGRFHMTQNNSACAPQLLSLCSRAQDLQLLKLVSPRARLRNLRSHCNEKPSHCHEEQPLLATTREKPMEQQDPA